jgi:hypothetical protein
MPLEKSFSSDRAQFHGTLTHEEIETLVQDRKVNFLQSECPIQADSCDILNDELFSRRPDICLRIYWWRPGHDFSFLKRLPNLLNFAAEGLMNARGVEHVADLPHLESLAIGIYDLESFDFLAHIPADISELCLEHTKSKKPSLELLSRFRNLKRLYLEAQQKHIEVISSLTKLEDLTLRSITVNGLEFIRPLSKLWSFDMKLGGTKDLSGLDGMTQLKYLELWRIKGLTDLSVISTLTGLQSLFLQDLSNVQSLPSLKELHRLRRVHIQGLKRLTNIESIQEAPALEDLIQGPARNFEPRDYAKILQIKSLKCAMVGFGNSKKKKLFDEMKAAAGVAGKYSSDFEFR